MGTCTVLVEPSFSSWKVTEMLQVAIYSIKIELVPCHHSMLGMARTLSFRAHVSSPDGSDDATVVLQ